MLAATNMQWNSNVNVVFTSSPVRPAEMYIIIFIHCVSPISKINICVFHVNKILTNVLDSTPLLSAITSTTITITTRLCRMCVCVCASIISTDKRHGVYTTRETRFGLVSRHMATMVAAGNMTCCCARRRAEVPTYVIICSMCVGPGQRTAFAAAAPSRVAVPRLTAAASWFSSCVHNRDSCVVSARCNRQAQES